MPRTCTICTHPERAAIDRVLVATASPIRDIAGRHELSKSAVWRHGAEHIPETLAKAREAGDVAHADDLLAQVRHLQGRAQSILDAAEQAGDYRSALSAIGQARACLELLAKLLGELDDRPQVNLLLAPEWVAVRAAVLGALAPDPEARAVVAGRLLALDGGNHGAGR